MEPSPIAVVSDSGSVTSELFLHWLLHFQDYVRSGAENPCLLILDNRASISAGNLVFFRSYFRLRFATKRGPLAGLSLDL
jgi:hypothetical protein